MPKVARTGKIQVVPRGQEDTKEMPAHLKVLADRGMYDRARRALRPWAILIVPYLSQKRGAKQASIREIGRVVFEGSANRDYRALVQSLLLDYLGPAKLRRGLGGERGVDLTPSEMRRHAFYGAWPKRSQEALARRCGEGRGDPVRKRRRGETP